MRVRDVLMLLVFALGACRGEFFQALPTDPGAPTAPSEVIAVAGPDLVVLEGSRVVLAAGASRALRGEPVLAWTQREGPLVTLSNPSSAAPVFVAPLGPTRLVFVLEAAADTQRDEDEVVVDVVAEPDALRRPAVLALPGDRIVSIDERVVIEAPWGGAGEPHVSVRCPTLSPEPLGQRVGDTLRIEFTPRALPCPVVIENRPIDTTELGDVGPLAGRAAMLLLPEGATTLPASRATAAATVDPGARVEVTLDVGGRAFVVDGTPLTLEDTQTGVSFTAPRRPGRLVLVAETRRDDSSGGTRVLTIEVGAGTANAPPTVTGGPDRRVRPGARFRITPTGIDDDDDPLSFHIEQVLGLPASPVTDTSDLGVALAPDVSTAETLLFFVVADDGVAESAPDPVRVVVDPTALNLPPILDLPPELYVTPGSPFLIDASSAADPDAGLIEGVRFVQAADDPVQILDGPVEGPRLSLVAGPAGERYHFLVSVVDADGLEAVADVVVIVEEAGPFVDPNRAPSGNEPTNGTVARPFRSVSDAVATAVRHRFPSLYLAAGVPTLEVPTLPDGLGLEGGWRYESVNEAYVVGTTPTFIALTGPTAFGDVVVARVVIQAGPPQLELLRLVELTDIEVDADVTLEIARSARVRCHRSRLFSLDVEGRLELANTSVREGLTGRGAVVSLGPGTRVAAPTNGVAVELEGGVLLADADASIVSDAGGIVLRAGAVATVAASVQAAGDDVVGIDVVDGTLVLEASPIFVQGAHATGVRLGAGSVGGHATISARGEDVVGVHATVALGASLSGVIEAVGEVRATGVDGVDVALEQVRVEVSAPSAVGVVGDFVTVSASIVEVRGDDGDGVVANEGSLRHATIIASDTAITGLSSVHVDNSLAFAPVVFAGDGVVAGVVGVIDASGLTGCARCVSGPREAVDAQGRLVDDETLGVTNPFVDSGDPLTTVPLDFVGQPIPQGGGPDLGAHERPAASQSQD